MHKLRGQKRQGWWEEREEDGTVDDKAKHRTGGRVPSLSSHCLVVFEAANFNMFMYRR